MSIRVTLVTAAKRSLCYVQSEETAVRDFLTGLRMTGHLFTGRTLVIASETETQIISPAALTRIEVETQEDLASYLPSLKDTQLTLIPEGAATAFSKAATPLCCGSPVRARRYPTTTCRA